MITVAEDGLTTPPATGGAPDGLGSRFALKGALGGDGKLLKAALRLVNMQSGAQLWSRTFESGAGDPNAVFRDLSDAIAAAVCDEIRDAAREAAARKPADARRAFEWVLLANERRWRWSPDANAEAIALVERALALEPRSAMAWTELARLRQQQVYAGFGAATEDAAELWRQAATAAVEHDANHPFARAALADLHMYVGSWDAAAREIEQALSFAPWMPEIMAMGAEILPWPGHSDRAAALADRARRLDPVPPTPARA